MALRELRGHNPFRCAGCGQQVPWDKNETVLVDEDTGATYEVKCKPKAPAPKPPEARPVPPPNGHPEPFGPMKIEKAVKIGLPAFSSASAMVQDWARPGETEEQLAARLRDRLEREIDDSVRVAFRVHDRIARGEGGKT